MPNRPFARYLAFVALTSLLMLAWTLTGRGQPDTAKPGDGDQKDKPPTKMYFGASQCARCHRSPLADEPAPVLCRCVESKIWEEMDKHKLATKVLEGDRAKEMG